MRSILVALLLCPLTTLAAEWRYDGAPGLAPAADRGTGAMAVPAAGPAPADALRGGLTMNQVRAARGDPQTTFDAVGTPPITRWQYPGYVIYFERDRVITSVAGRW